MPSSPWWKKNYENWYFPRLTLKMILHSCPPPPDGKTVKTADISPCFNILHICTFPLDHKPIKTHIVSVLFLTVTKTNIYPCFNVCLTVTWSSSKNSSSASASWYCWYSLTCAFEFDFVNDNSKTLPGHSCCFQLLWTPSHPSPLLLRTWNKCFPSPINWKSSLLAPISRDAKSNLNSTDAICWLLKNLFS